MTSARKGAQGAIVGVDCNTKYLAVVALDSGGQYAAHWLLPPEPAKKGSPLERLYAIHISLRTWLRGAWARCVYIEDAPFVQNRKVFMQLSRVIAAVLLACMDAGVPVVLVGNTTWKKIVVGSGSADKSVIKVWAQQMLGVPGGLMQDVYDAACVAHYGMLGGAQ